MNNTLYFHVNLVSSSKGKQTWQPPIELELCQFRLNSGYINNLDDIELSIW